MTKTRQAQQHVDGGIPGPPGPRGPQGPTGATGKTGPAGRPGLRGAIGKTGATGKLSPSGRRELLSLVHGQVHEVASEMAAQMKRMTLLKDELEELRVNVTRLMTPTKVVSSANGKATLPPRSAAANHVTAATNRKREDGKRPT